MVSGHRSLPALAYCPDASGMRLAIAAGRGEAAVSDIGARPDQRVVLHEVGQASDPEAHRDESADGMTRSLQGDEWHCWPVVVTLFNEAERCCQATDGLPKLRAEEFTPTGAELKNLVLVKGIIAASEPLDAETGEFCNLRDDGLAACGGQEAEQTWTLFGDHIVEAHNGTARAGVDETIGPYPLNVVACGY